MIVETQVTINGSKAAVWAAITDIEHAAEIIRGIDRIEIVEKPAGGLVGLRWRETRMFFGKPATVEKTITAAGANEFYQTRAGDDKCVYLATLRIAEGSGGITLATAHESRAHGIGGRVMLDLIGFLFNGVARKALRQDLDDIKAAVERK